MADRTIIVDPAKLESTAGEIDTQAAEYKRLYEQLYSEVDSMASAWQGSDNLAFTSQIDGFREDFTAMYTLMTQYSEFLKNSAATYRSTQENVAASAKRLVN
ncbi:MAG: WXG100 family type VII secretion target [Lachnospiraceae bacterium]|nr:WXG100 family type VII secretion target [Lachnospiraceae bacterium]